MTTPSHLSIAAAVSAGERAAVQAAAGYLARSLSQAAGVVWTCDCVFAQGLETLGQNVDATIVLASLLPEVERTSELWPETERRQRTTFATLAEKGVPVFLCTILRHVGRDVAPEAAMPLRVRIRRLNLLAAEISRETGAYVLDLDRVLANIGAQRLGTDYRLEGQYAAEQGGHFIAATLVNYALDATVPVKVQDAAAMIIATSKPEIPATDGMLPELALRRNVQSVGRGRRKQTIAPVDDRTQEHHAKWLVGQVVRGEIGLGEALTRLLQAMRRRGVRACAAMLLTGLSRQINGGK
jgi:hypothetical protein